MGFCAIRAPRKNPAVRSLLYASFLFAQQNREWINADNFRKESVFGNHFPSIATRNNYSSIVPAKYTPENAGSSLNAGLVNM